MNVPFAYLLPIIIVCCVTGPLRADFIIVGYDSTNPNGSSGAPAPDLPASDVYTSVTPLSLSRGSGLESNQGITFNSRNWSTTSSLDLQSNRYIQWGWSSSTQLLDLTTLTLQYDRSSTGPEQLAIAASADGSPFSIIFSDSSVEVDDETHGINLSQFKGVSAVTFRLFGYAADGSGGTLDIEEFQTSPSRGIVVRGEISAVPEPTSSSIAFIFVGLLLRRRRMMPSGEPLTTGLS